MLPEVKNGGKANRPTASAVLVAIAFVMVSLATSSPVHAATIQVINSDAGTRLGFDDRTPVSPVSGNSGTTLGAQRLNAFTAAANTWGSILQSNVPITVDASMPGMSCSANSGTLGAAGPRFVFSDFRNAPAAETWYPVALANSFTKFDLDPNTPDIRAQFNRLVDDDNSNCLFGLTWSYVIGASNPGNTVNFTNAVLHELAHGLGFISFVNEADGSYLNGLDDQFSRFLLDETPRPTLWSNMDNAGRAASATDNGQLTWSGPEVAKVSGILNNGAHSISGRPRIHAPSTLDPGSSVSHWDEIMSPSALMEPNANTTSDQLLTNHVMMDIGWKALLAVEVINSDNLNTVAAGSELSYTLRYKNKGPGKITVAGATVTSSMPSALTNVSWTCHGSGGGTCTNTSGNGTVSSLVTLPLNASVTFTINASVSAGFSGELTSTASISLPVSITNTLSSTATDTTTVTAFIDDVEPSFHINAGLNGAWLNEDTIGQGYFLEVYPDSDQVFFAMFSYDTSLNLDGSAHLGSEGHRWLTAQGSFAGDTAELDVYLTIGGLFNDPAPVVNTPEGTITLNFQDCTSGRIDFDFIAAGASGSIPITRIAEDNLALCEELDSNAESTQSLPVSAAGQHLQSSPDSNHPASWRPGDEQLSSSPITINPGLSGAWLNPATPGQGVFVDVYPDINLVFFAWFTYDTELPDPGATAQLGYAGHRWLTAQGGYDVNTANLDVYLTSGGLFNDPRPVVNSDEGTVTMTFTDCANGTVSFDFIAAGVSGTIPISRISNDNVLLCEALSQSTQASVR